MLRNTHPYTPIHHVRLNPQIIYISYIEFADLLRF